MHNIVSKLLIYGDMPKDSILMELSSIIREFKGENYKKRRDYHKNLSSGKENIGSINRLRF